jgi:glycosyltransferase involved in cell wall biosynthesis
MVGRIADRGTDLIISNSHATAAALRKGMRMPEKVLVVHNAVDTEEFSPEGPATDVGAACRESPKVGLPAAFVRIKGHELLLGAVPKIRAEFSSAKFFFIGGAIYDTMGDRGYESHLRRLVQEKGLGGSVIFTGFQERMAPWYRAMDVIVNTSTVPEGFGRTLLEGMACGRSVVGPRAGGVPEFVRHEENGLLYEMGDAEGLAEAVLTLLRKPEWREKLGAAGRRTAVRRFGLERHARAISKILHDAAGTARMRRTDRRSRCVSA